MVTYVYLCVYQIKIFAVSQHEVLSMCRNKCLAVIICPHDNHIFKAIVTRLYRDIILNGINKNQVFSVRDHEQHPSQILYC